MMMDADVAVASPSWRMSRSDPQAMRQVPPSFPGGVNYCLKFSLFRENLPKWREPKSNGNSVFSDYDLEAANS